MILRRILGFLLIFGAAAGFIFGVVGLIAIWRYQPGVTQSVVETLDLMDRTVNASQNGLVVVGDVLKISTVDVASLQTTIDALAQTVHGSSPMLDSLTNLTRKDFPAALCPAWQGSRLIYSAQDENRVWKMKWELPYRGEATIG